MGKLTYRFLFGFLVAHFLLPGTLADCPPSFMNFNAHCYGVVATTRSWMDAEVECQTLGHGGHLASLLNEPEHAAVANYMKNSFPTVDSLWIGFHDPRHTRNWAWSDSSPLFYLAWAPGEPNNKDKREFCVRISKDSGFKKWYDADCLKEMPYLCKTKL